MFRAHLPSYRQGMESSSFRLAAPVSLLTGAGVSLDQSDWQAHPHIVCPVLAGRSASAATFPGLT